MTRFLCTTLLLTGLLAGALRGQTPDAGRASDAIARGDLPAARVIYDSLLAVDPDDPALRVARGHLLSWMGAHDAALADFARALQVDPADASAWLGSGYASAWSHRWADANAAFHHAAELAPDAAEKGLAYVALWRGDHAYALAAFGSLAARRPMDPEAHAGLGFANLAAGRRRNARAAFRDALRLDPTRADARAGQEAASYLPARLEITAWSGYTRLGSAPVADGRFGLRSAQLALAVSPGARAWVGYDDGLALDNPTLAASGEHVPWVTAGGYLTWGGALGTRIEAGTRDLGPARQWTASLEQVATLPSGVVFKVSGWTGLQASGPTEWVAGAGVSMPASSRVRLELLGFASGNGHPDERGYRALFSGGYRLPEGVELGAGVAAGRTAVAPSTTGSLTEGWVTASVPVGAQRIRLQARHQAMDRGANVTSLAVGVTLALWER